MSVRVQAIFEKVIGVRPEQRSAILDEECGSDDALRREIESLLTAHDQAGAFLDSPTIDATVQLRQPTDDAADAPTHALPGGATKPPAVPQQLGPVRLMREIGRGGMGSVWLGRDDVLRRDVAVKFVLNITATRDSHEVELFLEGARAAAAVDHPGLTTIHHADVVDDMPYLVMDYVRGASLAEVLKQRGSLSIAQTAAVLNATCEVLSALHDAEIVHRDIKPSNILLSRDGRLLVTDFGLACDRVAPGRSVRVKGLMGTPAYMAPEMFDGVISPRTDIYALGVTAYELLTGETPFSGECQIRREGEARDLPREALQKRDVPEVLIDLIERMANPNPMFRLKSARQVQQLLEKALGKLPAATNRIFADLLSDVQPSDVREGGSSSGDDASSSSDLATLAAQKRNAKGRVAVPDRSSGELLAEAQRVRPSLVPASGPPDGAAARPDDIHPSIEGGVPASIPCLECGHDLRGLPAGSRCAECGMSLSRNLSPDRTLLAPAEGLRRLGRGAQLAGWGVVLLVLYWIAYAPLILLEEFAGLAGDGQGNATGMGQMHPGGPLSLLALAAIHIAATLALCRGAWHLAEPNVGPRRTDRWRRAVRGVVAAAAIGGIVGWIIWIGHSFGMWDNVGILVRAIVIAVGWVVSEEAPYLCFAMALVMTAARWRDIPSPAGRRIAQVLGCLIIASVLVNGFSSFVLVLAAQTPNPGGVATFIENSTLLVGAIIIGGVSWMAFGMIAFAAKLIAWFLFRRFHKRILSHVDAAEPLRRFIGVATVEDTTGPSSTYNPIAS